MCGGEKGRRLVEGQKLTRRKKDKKRRVRKRCTANKFSNWKGTMKGTESPSRYDKAHLAILGYRVYKGCRGV